MPAEVTQQTRILVVDDSLTIRRFVEVALRGRGYAVHTAADGATGLEVARDQKPALILLDFMMPEMNGHVFCKRLRNVPELEQTPVILISAKGDSIAALFHDLHNVARTLSKPFDAETLVKTVESVLIEANGGMVPRLTKPAAEQSTAVADVIPALVGEAHAGVCDAAPTPASFPLSAELEEIVDRSMRRYFEKGLPGVLNKIVQDCLQQAGVIPHAETLLSGSLAAIALPELLNFLHNGRVNGRLVILGQGKIGQIYLVEGDYACATLQSTATSSFLTDVLERDGVLRADRRLILRILRETEGTEERIGAALVRHKLLGKAELIEHLRRQAIEAFHAMLDVRCGAFFLDQEPLPVHLADYAARVPLTNLLLEGLRLLDERVLASNTVPDTAVPARRELVRDSQAQLDFTEAELALLNAIDGQRTVSQLADSAGIALDEIKHMCRRLASSGLIGVA